MAITYKQIFKSNIKTYKNSEQIEKYLPYQTLKTLYKTLIFLFELWYTCMWFRYKKVNKTSKESHKGINKSKYNADTGPLFKSHKILKLDDMYRVNVWKVY